MRSKSIAVVVVTAACLAVAGGYLAERGDGDFSRGELVVAHPQEASDGQLGVSMGWQASGPERDVFPDSATVGWNVVVMPER